jgi:hypothetical protein
MVHASRNQVLVLVALTIAGLLVVRARAEDKPAAPPKIQMTILLDTSNSMDGLINQARTQLWRIVNEFTKTKLGGREPTLEVALYEYGNDSLPAAKGHIRLVVPMTSDLDKVSQELFALKTNGGQEYCGQVIDQAVRELAWSKSEKDLKCIFIAGNEPFTQGGVNYRDACKAAANRGITVSTIFCGNHQEGIQTDWESGAKLADGSYLSIDQDQAVAAVTAPQDKELSKLSEELNKTYIAYGDGEKAKEAVQRQAAQDANAAGAALAAAATRAAFKASKQYRADWDLVDAVQSGKVKAEDLKDEVLPEELRKMTPAERGEYVRKMAQKRQEIQQKIKQLGNARDKYVAEQDKKMAPAEAAKAERSFDRAVIRAVEEQAAKKK